MYAVMNQFGVCLNSTLADYPLECWCGFYSRYRVKQADAIAHGYRVVSV